MKPYFMNHTIKFITALSCLVLASISYGQNGNDAGKVKPSNLYQGFDKFRIGGYGEILYQHMNYGQDRFTYENGTLPDKRAIVDIPRMIVALEYKFNPKLIFSTEIEFEHGGAGSAVEIEFEEFGEFESEVEKGGEVVLEQMHLTYAHSRGLNIRAGHIIIPVGLTNTYHLPIEFFGSVRPEGENNILPLTWHETGIAILGDFKRWHYQAMVVNGLDANGFSRTGWISTGKQSVFEETKATNLAFAGRVENKSIRGLRLGTSFYTGKSTGNTAKPEKTDHIDGRVTIGSFDFEYNRYNIIARGNYVYGNLGDSEEITRINRGLSTASPYPRTPVAKNATTYALEVGYNMLGIWNSNQKLYPFARYEYYNTMEETAGNIVADARFKRQVATVGLNYMVLPNLVIKADYSIRVIDQSNYNQENTFGLGIAYTAWFFEK